MSRRGETRRRTLGTVYESDRMQNAEAELENAQAEMNILKGRSITVLKRIFTTHRMSKRLMDRLLNNLADTLEEKRSQLRIAMLKAEMLEKELHLIGNLREDDAAEGEFERACMRRVRQMEERENQLPERLIDYLSDHSSNEPEPVVVGGGNDDDNDDDGDDSTEEEDITEHASWYCTAGRGLTENRRNPYWESQERVVRRSEGAGTSSWLPGVAATSGNNETTICDGGTSSSTTVPHAAIMSNGRVDGQSEMCPICLCGFVTQEIGTPEACNHSFCADCLQEWLKNTNTCPIDRQVCDTILVRHCLGGRVVRKIHMEPPRQQQEHDVIDYFVRCGVCGDDNRISALINCDRCGRSYHLDCIYPRLDTVPLEEWFCSDCS